MSSDSQQSPQSPKKSPLKSQLSRNNSFTSANINMSIKQPINVKQKNQNLVQNSSIMEDNSSLYGENKKLRRKLKQLSQRLDQQLQRAAQNKLKMQNLAKMNHPIKQQSQNLQLQNAYKIIQRLQKAVKDFQNKESYQVSVKRIMDLQSIIKKKQTQIQELKQEVKTNKKLFREKQKYITELLQNSKKEKNVTQDKQLIERMKKKMKKLAEDNDMLRKKQLSKHEQLVKAQRKIVQMQQGDESPIGREQSLVNQLEQLKKKYKETMQRVDKQNIYITKLNEKLDREGYNDKNKGRLSENDKSRREVSKSLQQLPSLKKTNKIKQEMIGLMEHLPSPKAPIKLKRY